MIRLDMTGLSWDRCPTSSLYNGLN